MPNRPAPFKQIDVTRAIKGAQAADIEVGAALINRDGSILIVAKGEGLPSEKGNIDKMLGIQ